MDIYSTAKRLAKPFVFKGQSSADKLPIDARGLIGDGQTCALVRVDGVIDWACFPRFDSPAVFGAILDADKGGCAALTPVAPFESLQRYDPDTNVLETLFRVPDQGVARLLDYMPWRNDPGEAVHEIHRRVQCLEGEVEFEVVFDPRFDYGRSTVAFDVQPRGVLARGSGGERMVAVVSGMPRWSAREAGGYTTRLKLRPGQQEWVVLSWDAPQPEALAAYRPHDHLRATRQAWREFARTLDYDGPWRHHVVRSALVLKLLIHGPTGAMVAAPTTSLPEWIGGTRNWDYRYVWTRDSAMAIRAANLIGYATEARDFFHFIRGALEGNERLQVMYTVDGSPVPVEQELHGLRGFAGSAPVRIGNGAREQLQLDTVGALVDAAYLFEQFGGSLPLRTWRRISRVVDDLAGRWDEPDDGIWEPRGVRRHNVHSKVMSWLAFERGSRLALRFGAEETAARWASAASAVRDAVCQLGVAPSPNEHFVASYGGDHVDGALLVLPLHGFLEPADPRVVATVDRVRQELGNGPFVHRYNVDDGVGGPEGAFTLCGFWLAEALALTGRIEEAIEVFVAHAEASNHVGLLAEEIHPTTREQLGNFPQAFSHLGLINAAARIDLVLRLRDEGRLDLHGTSLVGERTARRR